MLAGRRVDGDSRKIGTAAAKREESAEQTCRKLDWTAQAVLDLGWNLASSSLAYRGRIDRMESGASLVRLSDFDAITFSTALKPQLAY